MIHCFYHSEDLDGKCSGSIVKYFVPETILYPFNYGDIFPWNIIKEEDTVYLVDISLSADEMIRLNSITNLVYIDHHISKIRDLNLEDFKGSQVDGTAACILTWKYFIEESVPLGVTYLGRYDIWDLDCDVLNFHYGVENLDLNPEKISKWEKYIFNDKYIPLILSNGCLIKNYVDIINAREIKNAFVVNWEGYNVLAINKIHGNTLLFKKHPDYKIVDILMIFSIKNNKYKVSIYTLKDDIDVSIIAKKYGGGGHKKAAGFLSDCLF